MVAYYIEITVADPGFDLLLGAEKIIEISTFEVYIILILFEVLF